MSDLCERIASMNTHPGARKTRQRIYVRMTSEDRELVVRAAAEEGISLTEFANRALRESALRTLADRTTFALTRAQAEAWEALEPRPSRDLPELRALLSRPSPFVD